jgi:hypothetical protein
MYNCELVDSLSLLYTFDTVHYYMFTYNLLFEVSELDELKQFYSREAEEENSRHLETFYGSKIYYLIPTIQSTSSYHNIVIWFMEFGLCIQHVLYINEVSSTCDNISV